MYIGNVDLFMKLTDLITIAVCRANCLMRQLPWQSPPDKAILCVEVGVAPKSAGCENSWLSPMRVIFCDKMQPDLTQV